MISSSQKIDNAKSPPNQHCLMLYTPHPPEGIIPRFPHQMPLVGIWLFELHSVTHGY